MAISALPYFETTIAAADEVAQRQRQRRQREQSGAGRVRLDVEAEDVLEVGQAVVAAEAEVVAEEGELQRVGQRLGDDRQIDAGDARAEGEPAEGEGEHAGHQHHHQRRVGERVEAPPGDRQLLPVQEHHEVGQDRIGVDAARADLAHQIHAHRVAAEREEGAVAERQDAAIAPHQVERQREDRVAHVLAEQRDDVGRHGEGRVARHDEREHRRQRRRAERDDQERDAEAIETEKRRLHVRPPPRDP